jgi:membrane-associated phospholipid phosphatase
MKFLMSISVLTSACLLGAAAHAQAAPPQGSPDTLARDSLRDSTHARARSAPLVTRGDVKRFVIAIAATGALAPFDHEIQRAVRGEDVRDIRDLRQTANALAFAGGPGPFVAGGTLYVLGEATGSQHAATLGVTLTESVVLAAALNGVIKGLSGRALPNATKAEPGDFSFGRGFHDGNGSFVSFPSGHTAASFAAAAAISSELSVWNPSAAHVVTPTVYSIATLVAVSRLYQNVHWASDLPIGAVIGVWSGKTVAAWQERRGGNALVRRFLNISILPDSRRLAIATTIPFALQ